MEVTNVIPESCISQNIFFHVWRLHYTAPRMRVAGLRGGGYFTHPNPNWRALKGSVLEGGGGLQKPPPYLKYYAT